MTNMLRHIITISLLIFISICSICQNLSIQVLDANRNSLVGATVKLKSIKDSTVSYATTDLNSIANFNDVSDGLYKLKMSYIGFQTSEKTINVKPNERRFSFSLKESAYALDEVTVEARRPLIRQEFDRMIVDPEPIADISSNTLEILENTPGLFVDQDGAIYLSGARPAAIHINGREQRMSNQDIATILRSLPPGSIERIEILRTPSSRYDAASAGGIVNVVLKKGVRIGRFGSINTGMNQGKVGNRFAGFTINDSGDNSTKYLNFNYSHNAGFEEIDSERLLTTDANLFQLAETERKSNQFYLGYGINYDVNDNFNLNYDGRINYSLRKSNTDNFNLIKTANNNLISEIENVIFNDSDFLSIQQDFGFIYKLDTSGSVWDTKLSYSFNNRESFQKNRSDIIFPAENLFDIIESDNFQNRHFVDFQTDIEYYLPAEIKAEIGVKSSYQNYTSNTDFFNVLNDDRLTDSLRTNAFNYHENINAAYLQGSKAFGDFMLIGGLRLEHTYMLGNQSVPTDTSFVVNRSDLFPYVYLSRSLFEMAGFDIRAFAIYRKSITRPGYQSLSPSISYVDQFLFQTGNPALKPQFTENVEINVSFDDTPLFAIGRNYTSDIFSSVIYQDETAGNMAVRTYDNIGFSRETYFRLILGIPPGNRYFFAVGSQYNYNEFDGFYENDKLVYDRGSWRFFTFHSLRLFNETRLIMSGFLMTNGQFNNFYELNTFGALNFGIRQNFLNQKLSISINARDVLGTMITEFTFNQGSISSSGSRYADNRRFGINIRYNFGIRTKKERQNMFDFDIDDN